MQQQTSSSATPEAEVDGALGFALRNVRNDLGFSMRGLAEESGISAAAISRIESGEVQSPSTDTLVALARAMDCNPIPLQILAGRIDIDEGRRLLAGFLAPGTEINEAHTGEPAHTPEDAAKLAAMLAVLEDPESDETAINEVAGQFLLIGEFAETVWQDSFLLAAAEGAASADLRELAQILSILTRERRGRLMDFARDQAELARLEWRREARAGADSDPS